VIAQETGFSHFFPTGAGLFSFRDSDGVLGAIESIRSDAARHRREARHVAEEYFDCTKVLPRLLSHL
jgi:hypothetical protein